MKMAMREFYENVVFPSIEIAYFFVRATPCTVWLKDRFRELTRGSQDPGSRNPGAAFWNTPILSIVLQHTLIATELPDVL